jgi:hypothetical protein
VTDMSPVTNNVVFLPSSSVIMLSRRCTVYSAAVVILKSAMSRDAGSVPSVLGVTFAALKRTTSGAPAREVSTEARVVLRRGWS